MLSKQLLQEWEAAKQSRQQHDAAISILDVSRMHDGVQQQPQSINQDMPLLALNQFTAVKSVWINARTALYGDCGRALSSTTVTKVLA